MPVQVIRTGIGWNLWIAGTLTVLLAAFPQVFLHLFTRDAEAVRLGVPYLRVLSLCLVVNGMEIVASEAVLGSGHTRVVSWIFTSFSLLRIPLALVVAGLGSRRARHRLDHHRNLHRARAPDRGLGGARHLEARPQPELRGEEAVPETEGGPTGVIISAPCRFRTIIVGGGLARRLGDRRDPRPRSR